MARHARMVKTLASLIAAMTGTALLLGWIDPAIRGGSREPSQTKLAAEAESAVTDGVEIQPDLWRDIEVFALPLVTRHGSLLSATSFPEQAHFYVGPDAHVVRLPRWEEQAPATRASPRTIRVTVVPPAGSPKASAAQRMAVRTLLDAIQNQIRPTSKTR